MDLILETERLIMRPMLHEDAEALFDMDKNQFKNLNLWN